MYTSKLVNTFKNLEKAECCYTLIEETLAQAGTCHVTGGGWQTT